MSISQMALKMKLIGENSIILMTGRQYIVVTELLQDHWLFAGGLFLFGV